MRLVLGPIGDGAGIPVAEDADTGVHATFEDLARAGGAAAAYI